MVAQVDEQHAAMVADAVAPAGEADARADIGRPERPAGMGPITVHGGLLHHGLTDHGLLGLSGAPFTRGAPSQVGASGLGHPKRGITGFAPGGGALPDPPRNPHIIPMNSNAFFEIMRQAPSDPAPPAPAPEASERQEGRWRVLPLEGTFEIVYEDSRGAWSTRRVDARELKLGPGRTLLGGIDRGRGGYRGFRADRIRRLTDPGQRHADRGRHPRLAAGPGRGAASGAHRPAASGRQTAAAGETPGGLTIGRQRASPETGIPGTRAGLPRLRREPSV